MFVVDVHTMSVSGCADDQMILESLQCTKISADLLAWEDVKQLCEDRILRIDEHDFRGKVFITDANRTHPNPQLIPTLRFYVTKNILSIRVAADETPWIMCECADRCGACMDD
jgi:hypothetical protein